MQTCNFDNFNGNFAILSNFFEVFQIFRENLDNNLGKFENLHFTGFGWRSPPKLENLLESYSKNQWKPPIFWKFASILSRVLLLRCAF